MLQRQSETGGNPPPAPAAGGPIWLELTGLNGEKILIRADAVIHVVEHRSGTFVQTGAASPGADLKVKESRDEISRKLAEAGAKVR